MGNDKTANLRFLELRNLSYKGYKIHRKFYKMTCYLKFVKSKNLEFGVLSL